MPLNLNKRDQNALTILLLFSGLFLLFQLIVLPMLDHRKNLTRRIAAAEESLSEMLVMKAEFQRLKTVSRLSKSGGSSYGKDFSLFSMMERFARQSGIKDRIAYMKPSNSEPKDASYKVSMVEMKLEEVTTRQLLSFLYQVETYPAGINISRMSVSKTGDADGFIDVVIQAESYTEEL